MKKTTILVTVISFFLSICSLLPVWAALDRPQPGLTNEEKRLAAEHTLEKYLIWEFDEAMEPYASGNVEVAKHSLSHLAKILDFLCAKEFNKMTTQQDLGLTYMRLGKLAEIEGQEKDAREFFTKGVSGFNSATGKDYTVEDLRTLVDIFDQSLGGSKRVLPAELKAVFSGPTEKMPNTKMKADEK